MEYKQVSCPDGVKFVLDVTRMFSVGVSVETSILDFVPVNATLCSCTTHDRVLARAFTDLLCEKRIAVWLKNSETDEEK